ncbi:site-specific integrase [Marinimicrobium sp. ARAG 43.8]|uniref:site-specific integrase n=1 Tax=Marinimicrobium sp. ARAG 43.8 TaxID=3418719 RepID=UPI003CEA9183
MEDLQRPKNPPHRDRRIWPKEQEAILLCLRYSEEWPVEQQQQRVAVAFLFALETAMRAGEICALCPEHIDIEKRVALLVDTKNGFPRKVPLSKEALRLLERLRPWDNGEQLFRVRSGNLSTVFKKAVTRAGIEDLTFHDTRHEAITRLAQKLDVMDLARMVGHRDIKQLMTYYNKQAEELALQLD